MNKPLPFLAKTLSSRPAYAVSVISPTAIRGWRLDGTASYSSTDDLPETSPWGYGHAAAGRQPRQVLPRIAVHGRLRLELADRHRSRPGPVRRGHGRLLRSAVGRAGGVHCMEHSPQWRNQRAAVRCGPHPPPDSGAATHALARRGHRRRGRTAKSRLYFSPDGADGGGLIQAVSHTPCPRRPPRLLRRRDV